MFWVPQSGDIGLGVSILSYGGGVQFGVITDTTLCPEPQKIIDEFEPEFAEAVAGDADAALGRVIFVVFAAGFGVAVGGVWWGLLLSWCPLSRSRRFGDCFKAGAAETCSREPVLNFVCEA